MSTLRLVCDNRWRIVFLVFFGHWWYFSPGSGCDLRSRQGSARSTTKTPELSELML